MLQEISHLIINIDLLTRVLEKLHAITGGIGFSCDSTPQMNSFGLALLTPNLDDQQFNKALNALKNLQKKDLIRFREDDTKKTIAIVEIDTDAFLDEFVQDDTITKPTKRENSMALFENKKNSNPDDVKTYCDTYQKALSALPEPSYQAGERTAVKHIGLAILKVAAQQEDISIYPIGRLFIDNTKNCGLEISGLTNQNTLWSRFHGLVLKSNKTGDQVYLDLSGTTSTVLTSINPLSEIVHLPSFNSSFSFGQNILTQTMESLQSDDQHTKLCPAFKEKYLDIALNITSNSSSNSRLLKMLCNLNINQTHSTNRNGFLAQTKSNQDNKPTTIEVTNSHDEIAWFPVPSDIKFTLQLADNTAPSSIFSLNNNFTKF